MRRAGRSCGELGLRFWICLLAVVRGEGWGESSCVWGVLTLLLLLIVWGRRAWLPPILELLVCLFFLAVAVRDVSLSFRDSRRGDVFFVAVLAVAMEVIERSEFLCP